MQNKFQILKRSVKPQAYLDVKNGVKPFDVLLRIPGQELEVGDLITLQEVDPEGNLTGQEVTKKISSRMDIEELEVPEYVDREKALKNGVSVVGWVAPEQYTLKSVYDFGFTMHMALDRITEEEVTEDHANRKYNFIEGPFYSPPLASPEFIQYGVLDGFNINKWPIGRYSIILMIHVSVPDGENPVEVDTIDALILTVAAPDNPEKSSPLEFHELDVRALLDGKAITVDGDEVIPATPQEIESSIVDHIDEFSQFMDVEGMESDDDDTYSSDSEAGMEIDEEEIKRLMERANLSVKTDNSEEID